MALLDVNALVALAWDSHVHHAAIDGRRQVTDAHLLTLARRRGVRLVTFDPGIVALAPGPRRRAAHRLTVWHHRTAMDTGDLVDAVRAHRAVELIYRGGSRIVHPHAVYRSTAGKLCLDGVQVAGVSRSGALPGWREFELMKIADVRVLETTFDTDTGFKPESEKYRNGLLASA
jgi:hypothetical protein